MQLPAKSRRPEDAELSTKQKELVELQSRLAELELQLLTLRLDLNEFESLYCAKVGLLYAELDEVEALIAERLARVQPLDPKAAEAASNARKHADESRRAAADASLTLPLPVARSQNLRHLYRTAARQLHPDLSQDDRDRAIRERLMTEANLAYAKGDEAGLRAILEEYESSPDVIEGNDVGAELVRTIRRISLANIRIKKIETEISELRTCEIHQLKTMVEEGNQKGDDVLGDLAESLRRKVRARREYLQNL
jgi:hypothetical protein